MSYWAKSSSYFHCQAIQRLYFKLKLKSLLYLIRNRFDLDSTSSKPRWVGPLLCPLHGDLQRVITEIDQIASQIIYYIVYLLTCLLVLFTAKPKYLNVSLADGRDITTEIIGPFNEGHELRLVCESGGGKPIPRVTWYNGSSVISGMSFHDLFFYTTCIEYIVKSGRRLTEYYRT